MAPRASNQMPVLPNPAPPDIWKQMSYTPPRGPCAHKISILAPTCACLRFMIHPVKAASSFECDGCGHHASFHKMENRGDDEVIMRWRAEEGVERREVLTRRNNNPRLTDSSTDGLRLLDYESIGDSETVSHTKALDAQPRAVTARPVAKRKRLE